MTVFELRSELITIDNQQDVTILIYLLLISSTCSGDVFAHYQEHITNYQAGCLLVLRKRNTNKQQHRWTIPEAVVTVMMGENFARNM